MYSDRKHISSCQGLVGYSKKELMGGITKGPEQTFGVMGTLIILRVVAALWVHTYVKAYQIVHFKYVWFMVHQGNLNTAGIKSQFSINKKKEIPNN